MGKLSLKLPYTLPLCVRVDHLDVRSQQSLIDTGWREVGELMTWRGTVNRVGNQHVVPARGEEVVGLAKQIKWSGRLWTDKKIPPKVAWEETEKFLIETEGPVYRMGNLGFIVATFTEIKLVGVHPDAAGCGLAAAMIKATRPDVPCELRAGTYLHNTAAQRLYSGLGMKWRERQIVFHR